MARIILLTLAIMAFHAEAAHAHMTVASWLDDAKPASWNNAGASIPAAPRTRGPMDARCRTLARPAELPEDRRLQEQGWELFGAYQGGWRTLVIRATASYDGMCRPRQHQAFVFVRGVFAGTLSPQPMDSRSDGALSRITLESDTRLSAEYLRYAAGDALCCPSRATGVQFEIGREAPILRPLSASTSQPQSKISRLGGTANYRERMALPPNAEFEAVLEDVSRADAPAEVIGRTRIEHPGNPPIPFEVTYDPSRINRSHRYVVKAQIVVDGNLFFSSDRYPVLSAGQSNQLTLLLRRTHGSVAPGGAAPTASLENTDWKLVRLGDTPIHAASEQREPHFVLNSESRRVSGSGGCNRLAGSYELNGNQLTLGQMAGTMMACMEGMDTEKAFLDMLKRVSTWKVTGKQLELYDASGVSLARFEAQ
ncbi:MAG TPA: META domain-containing protein [Bryobacteraceae bacterium]|nr:META domain-containing protein [Bryobacteraceae bacterium]